MFDIDKYYEGLDDLYSDVRRRDPAVYKRVITLSETTILNIKGELAPRDATSIEVALMLLADELTRPKDTIDV